jgi:creatinine amidohydrolase
MTENPAWGRYSELFAEQLEAIIAVAPVAYVPWGALEWHGPHLPFGVDGFIAEALCERTARRVGGVVLPITWWPITSLPHRFSISIASDAIQALWDSLFSELARVGFKVAVVISGHYAQGHVWVLMDAAEHAIASGDMLVLAVPPLALVDEEMLDHAARWETAQMLALHPKQVRLDALPDGALQPLSSAVLGQDPRGATVHQGEAALALATERLVVSVRSLLQHGGADVLRELYARRRAGYQPYVERYFRGSWEGAIDAWWRDKTE